MGYYLIAIGCLYGVVFSYASMVLVKQHPPEAWGEWPYSKSRFAEWLQRRREKSRYLGPLRIDRFRLAFFALTSAFGTISLAILVVDLCTEFMITGYLGEIAIGIILAILLLVPPIFESSLVIWWSAVDRHSSKNKQIKRVKRIVKKSKNSKCKK